VRQTPILRRIIALKRQGISRARRAKPIDALKAELTAAPPTRPFRQPLIRTRAYQINVIAELKQASPSRGVIRPKMDVPGLARELEASGASALSVLTEERYFKGDLARLMQAKRACGLPILRKDFIIDEYQVYESRLAGADAVLLIVGLLPQKKLKELMVLSRNLSLAPFVEVHSAAEMRRALAADADLIGINTRDLASLKVDFGTAAALRPMVTGDRVLVCESGVEEPSQMDRLRELRFDAVLVGEALMRARHPGLVVHQLLHS
jgi:indole-3-glycerol phosphate synthase